MVFADYFEKRLMAIGNLSLSMFVLYLSIGCIRFWHVVSALGQVDDRVPSILMHGHLSVGA